MRANTVQDVAGCDQTAPSVPGDFRRVAGKGCSCCEENWQSFTISAQVVQKAMLRTCLGISTVSTTCGLVPRSVGCDGLSLRWSGPSPDKLHRHVVPTGQSNVCDVWAALEYLLTAGNCCLHKADVTPAAVQRGAQLGATDHINAWHGWLQLHTRLTPPHIKGREGKQRGGCFTREAGNRRSAKAAVCTKQPTQLNTLAQATPVDTPIAAPTKPLPTHTRTRDQSVAVCLHRTSTYLHVHKHSQ